MTYEVARRLKSRLFELNLSQSKAARIADIPQSNFNLIVNGKLVPCPSWRRRIAKVLQMSEEELFLEYINEKAVNKMDNSKCPLCGLTTRLEAGPEEILDIPDDTTKLKKVFKQFRKCFNEQSRDNDNQPCPNYGKVVDTIVHETIINRITPVEDLKVFAEKVIADHYTVDESTAFIAKLSSKVMTEQAKLSAKVIKGAV